MKSVNSVISLVKRRLRDKIRLIPDKKNEGCWQFWPTERVNFSEKRAVKGQENFRNGSRLRENFLRKGLPKAEYLGQVIT